MLGSLPAPSLYRRYKDRYNREENVMRNIATALVAVTALLTSAVVVAAKDASLTIVPSLDFGFKQSNLKLSEDGAPFRSAFNPSYLTLIPTLVVAGGQFYAALSYDTPLTEYNTATVGDGVNSPAYTDHRYTRQETTLNLGYRLLPALSIFAGYLDGETQVHYIEYTGNPLTPDPSFDIFKSEGYFAGVTTSRSFDGRGTLTLSAAYALLDASYVFMSPAESASIKSQDASGYSTSLSWTGPMGDSVFYRIGYRYARYIYKFKNEDSFKIEEPVRGLTFGVSKYF